MHSVIEVGGWIILASLAVLVVMNASNVKTLITSGSSAVLSESALLTGSGYGTANYGK